MRLHECDNMLRNLIFKKAEIPLETAILLIAGMTILITGALLFPVHAGVLPYHEKGLYGLLLVMFALQTITMGKTPFGDMNRSKALLANGLLIATAGIVVCFLPDIPDLFPRILLFVCFGPGSLLLLYRMIFNKDKLPTWKEYGGIFTHLIAGCSSVYLLSIIIAVLIWNRTLLPTPVTAAVLLLYGTAVIYLATVLEKIYKRYPDAEKTDRGDVDLSLDQIMILFNGVFMILLGILLIPVSLGLLNFSGSAQLGLLMVIFAVQMLASGNTPIGPFPRSTLIIFCGLLFASLGIISAIIPNLLVPFLTILVGVLNILGGVISLWKTLTPLLKKSEEPNGETPQILAKLITTQLVLNILSILFGTSMLVSRLIPGLIIGMVLTANGFVLLYLLRILKIIERMQSMTVLATEVKEH